MSPVATGKVPKGGPLDDVQNLYKMSGIVQDLADAVDKLVPISEARAKLPKLCQEVKDSGHRLLLTRWGKPVAALVPFDDLEQFQESLRLEQSSEAELETEAQ